MRCSGCLLTTLLDLNYRRDDGLKRLKGWPLGPARRRLHEGVGSGVARRWTRRAEVLHVDVLAFDLHHHFGRSNCSRWRAAGASADHERGSARYKTAQQEGYTPGIKVERLLPGGSH